MKNNLIEQPIPGEPEGLYEYRLVMQVDAALNEKLVTLKREFYFEYDVTNRSPSTDNTPPHITIACFFAREEMEGTFIRWLQRICSQCRSFPVTLNNYSGVPEHTIHLRVHELTHFNAFVQQLEPVNAFIMACSSRLRVVNYPYLPVATELPADVYAHAIMNYSQQTFHETFMANELILLKRERPLGLFKTITVFNFLPAPEEQVA
jgi:hypothetical protein